MNRLSWRRLPTELWVVTSPSGWPIAIYQSEEALAKHRRGRSSMRVWHAVIPWKDISDAQ